jgi:peroxiredoxin/predicted DsbA family dithiol-disulfide isomerase
MNTDAQNQHPIAEPLSVLTPGTPAPDFTLRRAPDETISLHDFRGQPVVLAFYPADWSPIGNEQMVLYNEMLPEFFRLKAELLGISVDGVWCHLAYSRDRSLRFPLLSDFEPKGAVSRAYGVYHRLQGTSAPALYVIDAQGIIRWSHVFSAAITAGVEDVLTILGGLGGIHQPVGSELPGLTLPVGERDHVRGPAVASVTLVEYGDFECPYCAAAYPVVKEIQRQLGSRLRFAFRHFPLTSTHPHARHAAESAEAAAAQGKFWEMHDYLFEHQDKLDDAHLAEYAANLGLDTERFNGDMAHHVFANRVNEDVESGRHSRVAGTPTFFINGVLHDDTYTLDVLLPAVRRAYTYSQIDT